MSEFVNDWYIIDKYRLIGIRDIEKMNEYISIHHGSAPNIPDGINEIAPNVFYNIFGLKSIYIPITVSKLENNIFDNNKDVVINIGNYYDLIVREISPDKSNRLNYKLIAINNKENFERYCNEHKGENPPIPLGVESVSDYVFKNSTVLIHLVLPESTICMCKQACANCCNLESIKLSKNFIDFGEEVFLNCSKLKSLEIPTSIRIMRANVVKGCSCDLKLLLFNKYNVTYKEFLLKNYLNNKENLLVLNEGDFKTLRTNNYLFVFNNNKQYRVSVHQLLNRSGFNKHTGEVSSNFCKSFNLFKGEEVLVGLKFSLKHKKPMPDDYIISNLTPAELKIYFKRKNVFDKFLTKLRTLSVYENIDANGYKVKRLTNNQYEIIIRLMCLLGLFDESVEQNKPINFVLRNLLGLEKNNRNTLSLSFIDLFNYFEGLLDINENIKYNDEFSNYFLYNFENLVKLFNKLKTSKNQNFLISLIKNSGKSNIYYIHDNITVRSHGRLHDKWINYKENNNNKQININNNKEISCLSFVDWALKYGDGSHIFVDLNMPKEQVKVVSPFLKFYVEINPLERLCDIFNNSKYIYPFVFYPNNNTDFYIEKKLLNIAKVDAKNITNREFNVIYCKNKHLQANLTKEIQEYLRTSLYDNIYAKVIKKNDVEVAYANCEMGHCANVKANGCEYLYESFFEKDCQPFMIYKKNNIKDDVPIANFRIDIDRQNLNCAITCLEVKQEVKFSYSYKEKMCVVKAFDEIIKKFVCLFKNFFDKSIKRITMGQVTHCDINDVLSNFYKIGEGPYECVKERRIVSPSKYNHFIIFESEK